MEPVASLFCGIWIIFAVFALSGNRGGWIFAIGGGFLVSCAVIIVYVEGFQPEVKTLALDYIEQALKLVKWAKTKPEVSLNIYPYI